MKLLHIIAIALVSVQPADLIFCETPSTLPSPTYVVHIEGLRAAMMSPDEKYLTVFVVEGAGAEVQVWDFLCGSLVQAHPLPAPEPGPKYHKPINYVRYTSDGELLAVYTGGDLLYVLRARDLDEVRTITIHPRTNVTALEVSPTGHRLAVRMAGDVRVLDLDSGEELRYWSIKVSPELDGGGLAWQGDSRTLAVSVADNPPCLRGGGTIYIFDVTSEKPMKSFRVKLLPSSIAFGVSNSLLIASNTCGGYFSHHTLDLPIFDSTSGRETGTIPAGEVGIRNQIAVSANGRILLAYADREKTTPEGFENTRKIEDAEWQVWELATRKLILVLPSTGWDVYSEVYSLSSSGRFVYASRAKEVRIFPVLAAPK
jgi:WD40 repeat protein